MELYINTKNAWLNIKLINEIKPKGKKKKNKLIIIPTILYRWWIEAIFFQLICQWLAFIYDMLGLEIYGLWRVVRTLSWRSLINICIILRRRDNVLANTLTIKSECDIYARYLWYTIMYLGKSYELTFIVRN